MTKVIVLGGGPAGMIAAIEASRKGSNVTLIEKNEKLGKKLYITGKGRCNLTNDCTEEVFLQNIPGNPYFLYSAIYTFNPRQLMDYVEDMGVKLKTERGNRVFPVSDKSSDIIKAFTKELKSAGAAVFLNTAVREIIIQNGAVKGVITADGKQLLCDKLVLATGGLSYPQTGCTGDGYKLAKSLGHTVTKLYPSLVPVILKESYVKMLEGLSLKNISITLYRGKEKIIEDFGEMIFTNEGVSGPLVLTLSRYLIGDYKDVTICIDLKPALDDKALDKRILKDFEKYKNKNFENALNDLLPQKIIPVILLLSEIPPEKKVHDITKVERNQLRKVLKAMTFHVQDTAGFNQAVITAGGITVDEIDPGTMASKIVKGLYFAGEVIDVDGYTGGFNLQIAFSTGYLAGQNL